jgi:hypothetical protein
VQGLGARALVPRRTAVVDEIFHRIAASFWIWFLAI